MKRRTHMIAFALCAIFILLFIHHENASVTDVGKPQSTDKVRGNKIVNNKTLPHLTTLKISAETDLKTVNVSCNFTQTKTDPSYKICIHNIVYDPIISKRFVKLGVWERKFLYNYKQLIRQYADTILLDVGTNIGAYSLLAAAMGHRVVSVEPAEEHMNLLKQSVRLNGFQDRMVLVEHAIADTHSAFSAMSRFNANPGSIRMVPYNRKNGGLVRSVTLGDLRYLFPRGATVVIKIDCEGFEEKAMAGAGPLFESAFFPYIVMEWVYHRKNTKFFNMMVNYGYYPVSHENGRKISSDRARYFVDLIWVHTNARLPENVHLVKDGDYYI